MGSLAKKRRGGNAVKTRETNRYPLRKIVVVIRHTDTIFSPNHVRFECGHEGYAWGYARGRCRDCAPKETHATEPAP